MHKNQAEASRRWEAKNKEQANYIKQRSGARSFINKKSSLEDIAELRKLLDEREELLMNETE